MASRAALRWKSPFNATAGFRCFWNLTSRSLFYGAILFQWFEVIGGGRISPSPFLTILFLNSGGGSSRCPSPGHSQAQSRKRRGIHPKNSRQPNISDWTTSKHRLDDPSSDSSMPLSWLQVHRRSLRGDRLCPRSPGIRPMD
jgi:hypothetical protein